MTLRTKILPAPVAPAALPRARLQARLDQGLSRRLTTSSPARALGKSTLLAAWAQRHEVAWYTLGAEDAALSTLGRGLVDALRLRVPDLPVDLAATPEAARGPDASADEDARADAFAAALSEALQERLRGPLALVLDDLHALAPTAPRCVRSRRCAARRPRPCTSCSPRGPSCAFSIDRLRGQGQVLELGGADLAFDADEVARRARGRARRGRAGARRDAARGRPRGGPRPCAWPARRCARWRPPSAARRSSACAGPAGALFGYLAREVLAQEPPAVRELVRAAAPLERVHPGLCAALGLEGAPTRSPRSRAAGCSSRPGRSTSGSRRPA